MDLDKTILLGRLPTTPRSSPFGKAFASILPNKACPWNLLCFQIMSGRWKRS